MCDALGIINFEDACVDITGLMDYRPALFWVVTA